MSDWPTEIGIGEFRILVRRPWDTLGVVDCGVLNAYQVHLIRSGDVVLDIGAGVGEFSVVASNRAGLKGKVIALEPNLNDFKVLTENLRSNRCTNCVAQNVGVAAVDRTVELEFQGERLRFDARTLRSILAELRTDRVDFVKIDVEGFEREIIPSEIELLSHARVIVAELHGDQRAVVQLLQENGFSFHVTKGRRYLGRALIFSLRHPTQALRVYRLLREALKRSPLTTLVRGPQISRGEGLQVGAFTKSA
jgi:23S rRNA U2552 (ribose-2'-O)-methylase RlmE/FtsJ